MLIIRNACQKLLVHFKTKQWGHMSGKGYAMKAYKGPNRGLKVTYKRPKKDCLCLISGFPAIKELYKNYNSGSLSYFTQAQQL